MGVVVWRVAAQVASRGRFAASERGPPVVTGVVFCVGESYYDTSVGDYDAVIIWLARHEIPAGAAALAAARESRARVGVYIRGFQTPNLGDYDVVIVRLVRHETPAGAAALAARESRVRVGDCIRGFQTAKLGDYDIVIVRLGRHEIPAGVAALVDARESRCIRGFQPPKQG